MANLDFRQGLPLPLNVVSLLRDSSGAVRGSRGAVEGTAATVRVKEYDPHEAGGAWALDWALAGWQFLAARKRGLEWGYHGWYSSDIEDTGQY